MGVSCHVVYVILLLAISVEHRLVTDRQTHDDSIYRARMESRGRNNKTDGKVKEQEYNKPMSSLCVVP